MAEEEVYCHQSSYRSASIDPVVLNNNYALYEADFVYNRSPKKGDTQAGATSAYFAKNLVSGK